MTWKERLDKLRRARLVTWKEIAKEIGITAPTLHRWREDPALVKELSRLKIESYIEKFEQKINNRYGF